jgi:hypothetical protein
LIVLLAGTAALIARRWKDLPDAQQQDTSELDLAARLCGVTVPYLDTPGIFMWFDTKKLYDEAISQTKSLMDAELWDQGYSEGQCLPIEHAIALAIQALKESG